jgi:nucleoid DNA-binding protein
MTKQEMIEALQAEHPELGAKKDISRLIDDVFGLVVVALNAETGDSKRIQRIVGLGTFTAAVTPPRMGRNPATGAVIAIPARVRLSFKPAAGVADSIKMVAPKPAKAPKRAGTVAANAASMR